MWPGPETRVRPKEGRPFGPLPYNEAMPEIEINGPSTAQPSMSSTPAGPKPKKASLSERLAAVEAERDALRAELDARANDSVGSWLEVVGTESRILGEMHKTLSWRVTKPLRFFRKVQLKVSEVGLAKVSQLAVADFQRRFKGRRR